MDKKLKAEAKRARRQQRKQGGDVDASKSSSEAGVDPPTADSGEPEGIAEQN